ETARPELMLWEYIFPPPICRVGKFHETYFEPHNFRVVVALSGFLWTSDPPVGEERQRRESHAGDPCSRYSRHSAVWHDGNSATGRDSRAYGDSRRNRQRPFHTGSVCPAESASGPAVRQ